MAITATLKKDTSKTIMHGARFLIKNMGPGILVIDWRQPQPLHLHPEDFFIFAGSSSADVLITALAADVLLHVDI